MKKSKLRALAICAPLGLALPLFVLACGGSDGGGDKSAGGTSAMSSGGTSTMSSGGTSASGTTSTGHAGSSNNGGSVSSGGSPSNPGGDFTTGLPATTPLSSLTDDQATQLCEKLDNYFANSLKDFDCRFSGVLAAAFAQPKTDADAKAACKSTYDMCEAAPAESMSTCTKPSGTCTATVGELEACANDTNAIFDKAGMSLPSCSELTLSNLMDSGGGGAGPDSSEPASCTTLDMKCPDGPTPPSGGMMMP